MNAGTPAAASTAARCSSTDPKAAATALDTLTRHQLLDVLEAVPQSYWPPRPTRQDKAELKARVFQALQSPNSARIARAIFQAARLHDWQDQVRNSHSWLQRCTRCGATREKHRQHRRDIWPVWTYR